MPSNKSYGVIKSKLLKGKTVLLDGAMGSILNEGAPHWSESVLPWSVEPLISSPSSILNLHSDYLASGCDVLTANTFRTSSDFLRRNLYETLSNAVELAPDLNPDDRLAEELLDKASQNWSNASSTLTMTALFMANIARNRATNKENAAIALSVSTLNDCYEPSLVPESPAGLDELKNKHIESLLPVASMQDFFDLVIIETINTSREAIEIMKALDQVGIHKPIWISFVLDREIHRQGSDEPVTLYPSLDSKGRLETIGESIHDAIEAIMELEDSRVDAILFNCTTSDAILTALQHLEGSVWHTPLEPKVYFGGYANAETNINSAEWKRVSTFTHEHYSDNALRWHEAGARIIGGCCGTRPRDIQYIRDLLDSKNL